MNILQLRVLLLKHQYRTREVLGGKAMGFVSFAIARDKSHLSSTPQYARLIPSLSEKLALFI